jgi:hypothetical protein
VRGDLTKTEGFSNIRTDLSNNTCRFDYAKSDTELKAQLDELAKSNPHLRDWSKKD